MDTSFYLFFLICGDQLSTARAPRYATTAAGVYMEQCVHALKMRALRPLRETTYLRVEVHVTAYVAPAVADAPPVGSGQLATGQSRSRRGVSQRPLRSRAERSSARMFPRANTHTIIRSEAFPGIP